MKSYKIFKKNSSKLVMLTPLSKENKLQCAKLITDDDVIVGYNEDGEMYIEISQCPRIYLGMILNCKDLSNGKYEEIGSLIDIQYNEDIGYMFIFNE
jgi:hypothetical protein